MCNLAFTTLWARKKKEQGIQKKREGEEVKWMRVCQDKGIRRRVRFMLTGAETGNEWFIREGGFEEILTSVNSLKQELTHHPF